MTAMSLCVSGLATPQLTPANPSDAADAPLLFSFACHVVVVVVAAAAAAAAAAANHR